MNRNAPTSTPLRPQLLRVALVALFAWLGVGVSACASGDRVASEGISDTARRAYYEGMQELVDGNYIAATQLFQNVARSPRYVRYAALARLRIGDALYLQDRYQEATEIYRSFTSQYKSDPNLPYARFQVAACYYNRVPSEWFASPPAHEMDQTLTFQAEAELKGFLDTFPTSRFAPDARKMLAEVRQMLFDSELFAADFYAAKGRYRAVAWRLDRAIDNYPELGLEESLVWRMADAYAKSGDQAQAAKAYGLYLKSFPEGEHKHEAKERMEKIRNGVDDHGRT
ncbi:MAG: outer membrane protein assembly factor BamD [Deltaproteobacteria bacterium]|nr:MAG: outer membrane protein assembly factor BamD [Deltaproteobacteria bacterium]